ncbi:scavenger receptor [Branchiostoma belcheri]|nr:scavenger receptor [Branchiostoma belcheri]
MPRHPHYSHGHGHHVTHLTRLRLGFSQLNYHLFQHHCISSPECKYSSRIRLVGGSGPNEGRVEVRPADSFRWGTVCKNGFDLKDAEVVCRMLGYANVFTVRSYAYLGTGTGPIHLDNLQCDGTESSLFNCSHKGWGIHDCEHRDDVGVVCAVLPTIFYTGRAKLTVEVGAPLSTVLERTTGNPRPHGSLAFVRDHSRIRLVGGSSRKEGRVEVRPADSMTWGTVCHNQFDMKDADVVCKMLGYPSALQVRKNAYFGQGRGPVYMDDLQCNGNENSLFNCSYPGWTIHDSNCNHDQDVGVGCTDGTWCRLKKRVAADFFDHINQIDDNIKFTQEPSHDNMLPFLDTKTIVEEDDNIITSDQAKTDEHRHLRGALATKTGLSTKRSNIRISLKKTQKCKPLTNKKKVNITIPYVQGVSEKLRRIFQNFSIAKNLKPHSTLRQRLVRPKDRPHKGTKANVIYRLKCEEPNCKNTYIGETRRPLKVRFNEHCRPSANGYSSAIFHHFQHNQGHSFKLESMDILGRIS